MIDLHIHTNASADAQHSPAEIFEMARELGVKCLAFADHNVIAAVPAGYVLQRETGIEFISGIELNTTLEGLDLHLLGYGFDPADLHVLKWMKEIEDAQKLLAAERVGRFVALGLELTLAEVLAEAAGRPPTGSVFFDVLIRREVNQRHPLLRPYLSGPRAEDRYVKFYFEVMANGGPADAGAGSMPIASAIERLLEIHAVPVIAHPRDLNEQHMDRLVDCGLLGIEAICSYHDQTTTRYWCEQARRRKLLVTAGSDFHGRQTKATVRLAGITGNEYALVVKLREAIDGLARR